MIKFSGSQVKVDEDTYKYLKGISEAGNPFVLQMACVFSYLKPVDFENMTTDQYRSFTDELIVFLSGNYEGISVAEKKYYWRSKKKDNCGIRLQLNMNKYDSVEASYNPVNPLTESELREWGYNPDMYDREEVE